MEIKINVINKGKSFGTVGWLAEKAVNLEVGTTQGECRAVFLKDKDNQCVFHNPIVINEYGSKFSILDDYDALHQVAGLTEACTKSLESIIELAFPLLDEDVEPITFRLDKGN